MAEERKITIVKKSERATMTRNDRFAQVKREQALKELEALETEVGRINKRIVALKDLLTAA